MKKYIALKASAGSGKTFALTVRYISLLLLGAKPHEILTLTFTNKAANEMSERIYQTLLTLGDDEAYLDSICEQSGLNQKTVLGKKSQLVKQYTGADLSIYTIDKFVNKILREFCGYVGVSDDFEIREDDGDDLNLKFLKSLDLKQFDKLIDFALYENKKFGSLTSIFKILIEKNEKIDLVNIDSELIALQKTQVLNVAYKVKEFILNTASTKSAINAVDFDSFESLLIKGKTWLAKQTCKDFSYFKKFANDDLESYFASLKQELVIYYKLRSSYSLNNLFELFYLFKGFKEKYNRSKNYLEFNDISNLVYDLLQNSIDRDFLYFRLDSRYAHLLIDEFQDTSLLQYKILEPVIHEILSGDENKFKSFFYVGDTKQSIYRFRGGKRELFDYVLNNNDLIELEAMHTNYRSTKEVIGFVNDTFLKVPGYEYFEQLSIKPNGYVEVINDVALDEDDKFEGIAAKIANFVRVGMDVNNIAILTYTNADVLSLYSYLTQKFPGMKISTEMTSRLINQENVKAVINAIQYLYFKEEIYKENLNAILGQAPLSALDLKYDLHYYTVPNLVKIIATQLKLIDENVIKLIEVCGSFNNIVDFVYEIKNVETPMENKEQSGLQILTIFKSKGLEFDTVMLLDRIKRKVSDKGSLLFDYDSVELKNLYYKMSGLENFNEEYKKAIEKEKRLSLEDEINILYVALTRAKNNLIIFKKCEKSVFDILNLSPVQLGQLLVKEKIINNEVKVEKVSYTPLDLGKQDIKKQKTIPDEFTLHAKYFGIATHYCLEMMKDFTQGSLDFCLSLTKSKYANYLSADDFDDIYNRVNLLIEHDQFQNLIEGSTFTKEQGLKYNSEMKIIDLLVKKEDKYLIFDYKTTQAQHNEHVTQVSYYKEAIKEISKSAEVSGYVLYLQKDGVLIKEV